MIKIEPRFEIKKDKRGKLRFRLKAKNGKIVAVGQGYCSEQAVLRGIKAMQKCANTLIIERV